MSRTCILLLLATLVAGFGGGDAAYHAVVDAAYDGAPGAFVDGAPTYASLGAALATVPEGNAAPFVIFIREGRYHEKLSVDRPFVHLVGESREGTILTFDASGDTMGPDGERLGTEGSFTLRITAPNFRAERITIENGFDYPANAAKADDDPAKVANPQAVAVMTSGDSEQRGRGAHLVRSGARFALLRIPELRTGGTPRYAAAGLERRGGGVVYAGSRFRRLEAGEPRTPLMGHPAVLVVFLRWLGACLHNHSGLEKICCRSPTVSPRCDTLESSLLN